MLIRRFYDLIGVKSLPSRSILRFANGVRKQEVTHLHRGSRRRVPHLTEKSKYEELKKFKDKCISFRCSLLFILDLFVGTLTSDVLGGSFVHEDIR